MAHNYNDNGTVREVGSGKGNYTGNVYEIDHGKVNMNGTVYEVGFASLCTVKITGDPDCCAVIINGTEYLNATTVEVEAGTVITLDQWQMYGGEIYINGSRVSTDDTYQYTVNTNVTIRMQDDFGRFTYVYITEE